MASTDKNTVVWLNHFAVTPREGGGTRHFELARELGTRGWTTTILASDFHLHSRRYTRRAGPGERAPVPEQIEGVRFVWLWAASYARNDWRRLRNWLTYALAALGWRPRENRPAVVIGSSPHLLAALAGERLARRFRAPFVLEVRDLWPESLLAASSSRKGLVYRVLDVIARYLYRRAERIIVLARGSGEYLIRRGIPAEKIVYVPNGVDVSVFAAVQRRPRTGDATFTLVYAGAHGPANGLDVVLDAAALLQERAPGIRILLVGDGPAKPALQARAAELELRNVELRPPVAKSEIPALFASVDAGLMVLRDAPLFSFAVSPNKLFDYFGAALPVVCNVPGDVAAMVAAAGAGEQASDPSAPALAEAIERLARRSADELRMMGESGRAWVTREHSRPVLAARLDSVLRELVSA